MSHLKDDTLKRQSLLFMTIILAVLSACDSSDNVAKETDTADTTAAIHNSTFVNCDTFAIDTQPKKEYKKAFDVWLQTTSLDLFLEEKQSVWREAKAWNNNTLSINSNAIIKCLCENKKNLFLYVPNHFYIKEKNGNEYFQFFIVNNSTDTVQMPSLDAMVNNISSSVSYGSDSAQQWLSFQQTNKFVECGNSRWTKKLPPGTAIESEMECYYIGLGDTTVNYRVELTVDKQTFFSNSIKINLMKNQLPYLGKPFN
jgi:hypothetical protein